MFLLKKIKNLFGDSEEDKHKQEWKKCMECGNLVSYNDWKKHQKDHQKLKKYREKQKKYNKQQQKKQNTEQVHFQFKKHKKNIQVAYPSQEQLNQQNKQYKQGMGEQKQNNQPQQTYNQYPQMNPQMKVQYKEDEEYLENFYNQYIPQMPPQQNQKRLYNPNKNVNYFQDPDQQPQPYQPPKQQYKPQPVPQLINQNQHDRNYELYKEFQQKNDVLVQKQNPQMNLQQLAVERRAQEEKRKAQKKAKDLQVQFKKQQKPKRKKPQKIKAQFVSVEEEEVKFDALPNLPKQIPPLKKKTLSDFPIPCEICGKQILYSKYQEEMDKHNKENEAKRKAQEIANLEFIEKTYTKEKQVLTKEEKDKIGIIFVNKAYYDWMQTQNEEDRECRICLVEYVIPDKLKVLPCTHRYHEACISNWVKRNPTCPFCQYEL